MAWIESHDSLGRHPKTRRAMKALNICRAQMIGHLHLLWWWALEFAEDGNLYDYDSSELAEAAEWDGDPAEFVGALVTAGFLETAEDGGYRIHDWDDYAGRLLEQRQRNAERQQAFRQRHKPAAPVAAEPPVAAPVPVVTAPVTPAVTVTETPVLRNGYVTVTEPLRNELPYRTVPYQTESTIAHAPAHEDTPTRESAPAHEADPFDDLPSASTAIPAGTPVNRRPDSPPMRVIPLPAPDVAALARWEAFATAYPRNKDGKLSSPKPARDAFLRLSATDQATAVTAAGHYAQSRDVRDGYGKSAIRFLEDEDWREYQTAPQPRVSAYRRLVPISPKEALHG